MLIVSALVGLLSAQNVCAWFSEKKADKQDPVPKEYQMLTNRLNAAQQRYEEFRSQIEQTITQARAKLTELTNTKNALQQEVKATEQAVATLQQTNEERYKELTGQEEKLTSIEQLLKEKSQRITDLMNAVKAEKLLAQKDQMIATIKQQLLDAAEAAKAVQSKLTGRAEELQQQINALTVENNQLTATINELQNTISTQRDEIRAEKQARETLADEVASLRQAITSFENEKKSALSNAESSLKEFEAFISSQQEKTTK
jgi:chromosome segregation ATPase